VLPQVRRKAHRGDDAVTPGVDFLRPVVLSRFSP
jgi:hypothetical protein